METSNHSIFRPAAPLVVAIALMATLACGTAAEPDPAATTEPAASASAGTLESNKHANDDHSSRSARGQTPASEKVIKLPIANRNTALTREDLRVSQGDTVRLVLEADEEGEIHVHGYDLTAEVSPAHPGELVFEASTAGAFTLNFHVFAASGGDDHHGTEASELVASEEPVNVSITAEPDAQGGVDVQIVTEGFRFAPDLVDQAHTPGAGHAHIYVDGEKLGQVFENKYHIEQLAPGEHEIRVSLNTNDHSRLTYAGKKIESSVVVSVPDVGQADGSGQAAYGHDGHDHSHGTPGEREIIAEVHLGNLEVYP